jgi:putative ABC transport system ATP-binding protein
MPTFAIETRQVKKYYENGNIKALDGADIQIRTGEFVAIMGPSGCGKSTLLHIIGALDRPTDGTMLLNGIDIQLVKNLDYFRSKTIGIIFQLHNLIPQLTALENVLIPAFETKGSSQDKTKKAKKLLDLVGLSVRYHNLPSKLSGGQRQRVAIARALMNDPKILLADEPTGSLDSKSSKEVLRILKDINIRSKTTIIMVTHQREVADAADRIIFMVDGKVA